MISRHGAQPNALSHSNPATLKLIPHEKSTEDIHKLFILHSLSNKSNKANERNIIFLLRFANYNRFFYLLGSILSKTTLFLYIFLCFSN